MEKQEQVQKLLDFHEMMKSKWLLITEEDMYKRIQCLEKMKDIQAEIHEAGQGRCCWCATQLLRAWSFSDLHNSFGAVYIRRGFLLVQIETRWHHQGEFGISVFSCRSLCREWNYFQDSSELFACCFGKSYTVGLMKSLRGMCFLSGRLFADP